MEIVMDDQRVKFVGACPIGQYDQITENEWLTLRKSGIGGSEAAIAMGMSQYSSPLALCMRKTGRMPDDDVGGVEAVKVGNLLEPLIRSHIVAPYIREITGETPEVLDPQCMYRSEAHPWMIANIDGFLRFSGDRIVGLEIKTGSSYVLRDWGGADSQDEIPDAYYCQVQHYMAVTGLTEFYVFGLIGNRRVLRVVPAHENFITSLIERERHLWDLVQQNDPLQFPVPVGSDDDDRAIEALGLPRDEDTADITGIASEIRQYVEMGEQASTIAAERKRLKQTILAKLGTHKFGEGGGYKITHSRVRQNRLNTERLKLEAPKIYEQYIAHTEYGRITIKEAKK